MNRTVPARSLGVATAEADISVDALSFSQEAVLGGRLFESDELRAFVSDAFCLKERNKSGQYPHLPRIIS